MSKKTELSEKHWQALKLLEEGLLSRSEIAKAIGYSRDHLDHLCEGSVEACGKSAILFKEEYQKITKKKDNELKDLFKTNTATAHRLISRVFKDIEGKNKITSDDRKILSMYTNALSRFQPTTSVQNLSYSYTSGLTAEELIHEFKRLKGIAESSFERGPIQSSPEGRTGEISEDSE